MMAVTIFPTINDVGSSPGMGKTLSEANLTALIKALLAQNFVVSGFTVPASSATLTLSVAAGEAIISGYRVVIDASTDVTCTASATNHIFLKLTKDALGNVTGAVFEVNTTGIAPADSVKIATAVAGANSITSTTDVRMTSPMTPASIGAVAKTGDNMTGPLTINNNTVWHAGNDGMNSGLDADLIRGHIVCPSIAGDCLVVDNFTEQSTTSTTPVKLKEIITYWPGFFRISFKLRSEGQGVTVYGRIYTNGYPWGTLRSTISSSDVTFTEDLGSFGIGDRIQIYAYSSRSDIPVYVSCFRIYTGAGPVFTIVS